MCDFLSQRLSSIRHCHLADFVAAIFFHIKSTISPPRTENNQSIGLQKRVVSSSTPKALPTTLR